MILLPKQCTTNNLPIILIYCDNSVLHLPPSTISSNCWLSLSYSNLMVVCTSYLANLNTPKCTSFLDLVFLFLLLLTRKKSNQEETSMTQLEHLASYPVIKFKYLSSVFPQLQFSSAHPLEDYCRIVSTPYSDAPPPPAEINPLISSK